jgi:hypothetical protein
MDLDGKLQIKPGQSAAVLHAPHELGLEAAPAAAADADVVVVFATNRMELDARAADLVAAVERGANAWLAYPKARQLGTDLNRDSVRELLAERGADTVRAISFDDVWSGLRFKPLAR